jgi:ATP-dependent helicase HepA
MSTPFHPGQRWVSETEPELGLGAILRVSARTVTVGFGASQESREYSLEMAPLRRVRFPRGETLVLRDGSSVPVESAFERHGLIHYRSQGRDIPETELSDTLRFNQPQQRLLAGEVDPPPAFDLRVTALRHQHRRRKSKVRGFVGGRIELIPHQLCIAAEVAARLQPRVLLADEVGLGKTIEACLIVHRLLLTGRAQRVLVLVPDSLQHQWFVELLRRFNLWFHLFDEERCVAIEGGDPEVNPFLDDQLVLASLSLFTRNERRRDQALAAGWDLLVVDEAHHLGWTPDVVSPEYAVVEALGRATPGLLLLTATPEQLGLESHFARLRLLDPHRFPDLAAFREEFAGYQTVARLAEKLLPTATLTPQEVTTLATLLAEPEAALRSRLASLADDTVRASLLESLLDRHGTGRVMFRNTRMTISGFPRRVARLWPLDEDGDQVELFERLAEEFSADADPSLAEHFTPDFSADPRVHWLLELLQAVGNDKVLLICRSRAKAETLERELRAWTSLSLAVFHEGLTLVQRDRHAAWFAEEDGARLLICSEIGSEGRNFQFSHHLVMFDLPLDPELLEQRIGRLDRIGQTDEIQLHLPFVVGSAQELLVRWYHEGLNSFEKNLQGGRALREQFAGPLTELALEFHERAEAGRTALAALIAETRLARMELTTRLEQGRDRLLELNSFRPKVAAQIVQEIGQQDVDPTLLPFLIAVFDHYGIHVEELAPRTYRLGSAGVFADSFPGLPLEGLTVTADRTRALSREDVQFLSWDHPLVTAALDLVLGSDLGNSSFGVWKDGQGTGLYLEAIFLLECVAPPSLHVDRFLPPTPLRVLVDPLGQDACTVIDRESLARVVRPGDAHPHLSRREVRETRLPEQLEQAEAIVQRHLPKLIAQARREMTTQLDGEIARLRQLAKVNPSVRPEEIARLVAQQEALNQQLGGARPRLEALRVIQRL